MVSYRTLSLVVLTIAGSLLLAVSWSGKDSVQTVLTSLTGQKNQWTTEERRIIGSLWLGSRPPPPPSLTNAVADDPAAARFGQRLFFDPRLSSNGGVSCSTCHQPDRLFTDGLKSSVGVAQGSRNAMSVIGSAYSPWLFWDGRKDSLWSQALAPLESQVEHGGSRTQFVRLMAEDQSYRREYEQLFGPLPDVSDLPDSAGPVDDPKLRESWEAMTDSQRDAVTRAFTNMGKALEAYQRRLQHGPSRFDDYAAALLQGTETEALLTDKERAGLKLFIGEAQCTSCHNGPLFTNNEFHNTAVLSAPGELPSKGRSDAVDNVNSDPTNCLSAHSDDQNHLCVELRFMRTGDELIGAHRTPSLRNVADTAPYMHAGQMDSLRAVLDQYNQAPDALVGHNEAKPLNLSRNEIEALEAFLRTLSGPIAIDSAWLLSPEPG